MTATSHSRLLRGLASIGVACALMAPIALASAPAHAGGWRGGYAWHRGGYGYHGGYGYRGGYYGGWHRGYYGPGVVVSGLLAGAAVGALAAHAYPPPVYYAPPPVYYAPPPPVYYAPPPGY